jgi:hypothetical protein
MGPRLGLGCRAQGLLQTNLNHIEMCQQGHENAGRGVEALARLV